MYLETVGNYLHPSSIDAEQLHYADGIVQPHLLKDNKQKYTYKVYI